MKKIAEGFTSEIFEIDTNKVLKLYKPSFSAVAKTEYAKMLCLSDYGVSIPTLYEEIETDGRHGYIMEKIEGTLLSDRLSKDSGSHGGIIHSFIELQHTINEILASDECFFNQLSVTADRIASNNSIEPGKREILLRLLKAQKSKQLCHNDLHFNNIIAKGDVLFVIDWNGAFVGDPLLDIAKTYVVLNFLPFEIGCNKHLQAQRESIVSHYVTECTKSYGFNETDFQICTLIRIAELTSLRIPARDSLLLYFERHGHLLETF